MVSKDFIAENALEDNYDESGSITEISKPMITMVASSKHML